MRRRSVDMLLLHPGAPADEAARARIADQLAGAEVGGADELGVFEITLEDDDLDGALARVWDAVAAAGADDHVVFLEHPDLPDHWRPRSRRAAT